MGVNKTVSIVYKSRVFRQLMFIKQTMHCVQIGVHFGRFTNGFARLFRRFKAADEVLGDFPHAPQHDVRRIFFLIGGEKLIVKMNQRVSGQRPVAAKRRIGD